MLAGPWRVRRPGSSPGPSPSRDTPRPAPGRAWASGPAGGRRRPAPGSRPAGTDGPDPARRNGSSSGTDGPSGESRRPGARARPGDASEPGARRPGGRRRPPNRATPGSTSYDAADDEPFEPGWTGATWYGASSGTYWTINPKEYADPRKHGPEYQRRARRSASGRWVIDPDPDAEVGPDLARDRQG